MLIISQGEIVEATAPAIRLITTRAFAVRLRPWWEAVEALKAASADFRLDWTLLEMAGYVDLNDEENLAAFQRLKTAVDALAASPEFVDKALPAFDLAAIQKDGVEKEAYNGPL